MTNQNLFTLINPAQGLSGYRLAASVFVAKWLILLLPLAMTAGWLRADRAARREMLQIFLSVLLALLLGQAVGWLWPQPRPAALHLGHQYLVHALDASLPSDHVTVFWGMGFAAFLTRRYAAFGFPLLAGGLLVGWSRVYLGVHFPLDVLAALPVALAGATLARVMRERSLPLFDQLIDLYARWERYVRSCVHRSA